MSAQKDFSEKIEKIAKVESDKGSSVHEEMNDLQQERLPPNREQFESFMNAQKGPAEGAIEPVSDLTKGSLMDHMRDLNRQVEQIKTASPDVLVAQADSLVADIEKLKTTLDNPDIKIKSSVQRLMRNRLEHIDDNLQIALNKAGLEYGAPPKSADFANPVERFLGFLTHGQAQLKNLSGELQTMALKRGELSPASMLMIQIKVGYIQQEIEFFTSLLNKGLESTKTIMNVQV